MAPEPKFSYLMLEERNFFHPIPEKQRLRNPLPCKPSYHSKSRVKKLGFNLFRETSQDSAAKDEDGVTPDLPSTDHHCFLLGSVLRVLADNICTQTRDIDVYPQSRYVRDKPLAL